MVGEKVVLIEMWHRFYVNGLWRLRKTYDDHISELKIGIWAITGGCDEEWSIQEMHFDARSNVGKYQDMTLSNVTTK